MGKRTCMLVKKFKFESCHHLNQYEGKCANQHGHGYKMEIVIEGAINPRTGLVMDFGILKNIVNDHIVEKFDHVNLNDVMDENPTAENMCYWVWEELEKTTLRDFLQEIRIWETEGSCAVLTASAYNQSLES
jgi:6-pyruvoyltetrahydropterin/6-carboxytetrahydropterin synthase